MSSDKRGGERRADGPGRSRSGRRLRLIATVQAILAHLRRSDGPEPPGPAPPASAAIAVRHVHERQSQLLRGLAMPVYSHSRLGVYETCPRQYRFQYVDKVPVPEVRTVEMFVGSQVHSALEYLYAQVKRGAAPALDAVLDGYRKRWTEEWTEDILIRREGTSADDYRLQGEGHIAAYYRRYHPFDAERTVAVERRVMFPSRKSARSGCRATSTGSP